MKVIGRRITVVECPKCGELLQITRQDQTTKYEYGHTYHYVDCCACGKKEIRVELCRVSGFVQLDNPGEYVHVGS